MSSVFAALFVVWIGYAAHSDWRDRRVTNTWITLGLLLGVALLCCRPDARALLPNADRLDCVVGFALGLLILLPGFAVRAIGASDIKFLAVLGIWTGFQSLLWIWIIASLVAMAHAVVYAVAISRSKSGAVLEIAGFQPHPERGVPYVAYLALGAMSTSVFALVSHQSAGVP